MNLAFREVRRNSVIRTTGCSRFVPEIKYLFIRSEILFPLLMDGSAIGTNGMYQDNDVTSGTEPVVRPITSLTSGHSPFEKLGKLDLSGGIRFDSRTFKNSELYTKPDPVTGFRQSC